jgi:hypothetical protein
MCLTLYPLRADITIGIRGDIIRIQIGDPCFGAIIPIAACDQEDHARAVMHFNQY